MAENTPDIYLDHAATTYLDSRVVKAMQPYWEDNFGNPSSLYRAGRRAKEALTESRQTIARALHCRVSELIFTGSGTESDNLAILGVASAQEEQIAKHSSQPAKKHIVTTVIEHSAVLNACRQLEGRGYAVTYLSVNEAGIVDPTAVQAALRPDTLLVSVMYANNEVGTIQPIAEIAAICKSAGVYLHTDACQAAGALSLDVQELGVDLLTLNASKIYGPKGIGALYVKQGVHISPLIFGGGQEKGLRSGTENIPAIVGFAKAVELMQYEKSAESQRLTGLRDHFIATLQKRLPDAILNGHAQKRLPNNINILLPGVDAEALLLFLDEHGIACATGSACDSSAEYPSHVLLALGLSPAQAASSIRLTIGKRTTQKDLDFTLDCLADGVAKLRSHL